MSEIEKYKKYLNFKANPRYLRRDFMVPLYTGTEPDIVPETSIEQQGMVVDPSRILPKNFTDDMPFVTNENNLEQLELADGNRVGFELGGRTYKINKPLTTEQQNRIKKNYPNADFSKFKYGFSEKDTNNYKNVYSFVKRGKTQIENRLEKLKELVLESNLKPFESLNERQVAIKAGYVSAANLKNRSEVKNILNQLIPLEEKFSNYLNNIINNLDNIPYEDIVKAGGMNKYVSKPFGVDKIALNRKISNAYSKPEFKEARDIIKLLSNPQVFDTYGKRGMFAGEVLDNLDATKSARRLKGGSIGNEIINTAERSMKAGNKNINFLTKPGTVDASDIVFEWNGKLYGKDVDEYKGRKVNNLTTDIYKLPEFNEYLDVKTKINELRKKQVIDPQTKKPTTYDQLLRKTYAKGFGKNTSYERSGVELDHLNIKDEPFSNLRPLPAHINQTAGLIKKSMSIIEDKDKALKAVGYFMPEDALENSILKFSDRVLNKNIPVSKTYDVGLRSITGGSKEYLSPESKITTGGLQEGKTGTETLFKGETQVMTSSGLRPVSVKERISKEFSKQKKTTVEYLTNYLNENPNQVKAFKTAGIVCRRSAGGKVDVECLAENIIKEVEKLETGTDLQKASAINKFKNAGKIAARTGDNAFDIIVGLGAGTAGKVFGSFASLSAGLSEASKGSYKEAARDIGRFLNPFSSEDTYGTYLDDVIKNAKEEGRNVEPLLNFKNLADYRNKITNLDEQIKNLKTVGPQTQDPLSGDTGVYSDSNELLNDLTTKRKNLIQQYSDTRKNITPQTLNEVRNEIKLKTGKDYKNRILPNVLGQVGPNEEDIISNLAENRFIDFYSNLFPEDKKEKIKEGKFSYGTDYDTTDEQKTIIEEMGARGGAADGGRIGLAGGGPKMGRRGFLGLIAGAAAAPDLIKSLKGTGQAAKIASKIKLEPAEGMYPWFPKLVEKVKEMGKPFEEKDLIMEPSYKNDPRPFGSKQPTGEEKLTKHVDGDTTFILREYPDGRIAVDIDSPRNQESFGQPVSLYYRPKMEIQNYKGEKKIEPPEFKVLEPEPRLFANGPDDVDITFTEVPKNPKRNTVFGDIEAAERFATGNIKNRKIIPVKQSLRNEMSDDPSTFIMRQSGELGSKARPEEIIKLPEEFASGGRVKFSGGGKVKFARMITDILGSLRQKLSFSSHLEELYGTEKAKEKILSPYRLPEGTNKSQHSDILMYIDESRQNLPKEYNDLQNILNEIEKDINNYDYISADKKGRTLLDRLPESFNFEKLPQNLFPMEDPLNDAFILFDPKREKMIGRYTMKYNIDPKTNKGIIQTYDTYDPVSKKFLEEKDWKLIGVDAREESGAITKEGLN